MRWPFAEAPVGESVDPCCASQAIPHSSDQKGEMTYDPLIPPTNHIPQNTWKFLPFPQKPQFDQR